MEKESKFDLLDALLLIGGIWLLDKLVASFAEDLPTPGIGGVGEVYHRKMYPFGKAFTDELGLFKKDIGGFVECIKKARTQPELKEPHFKKFNGCTFTGELRYHGFRVMVLQTHPNIFILLSAFKKQSNETPKQEIDKANARAKQYLAHRA